MRIFFFLAIICFVFAFHQKGFCGNSFIQLKNYEKAQNIPTCGRNQCDDPNIRNSYTQPMNHTIKLYWLVFNCSADWNSMQKIRESTEDANVKYSDVKVTFKSFIYYLPCSGRYGNMDYTVFDQNKVIQAVTTEIGQDYQKEKGIHIVTGDPSQPGLLGFMFFPGEQYSGIGFMNKIAIGRGQKTPSHEIGHFLGLFHTFHGISEVTPCSNCYEFNSNNGDNIGDFCQDTPPVIINWDCVSPLAATGNNQDQCNPQRTQWINPYENLMGYGECSPNGFTECQKRRMRCNYDRYLPWLK